MSRVIQYTTFPASDKYKSDKAYFSKGLEKLQGVSGHVLSYWGLQSAEEGSKNGYVITVWESADALKAFRESATFKDAFSSIEDALAPGGSITRTQLTAVKGQPRDALEKPITEIGLLTPKGGASASDVKAAAIAAGDVFTSNGYPSALGEAIDGSGVMMIVIGWNSVEESRSKVKAEPFAGPVGAFNAIASMEVAHASLDKH